MALKLHYICICLMHDDASFLDSSVKYQLCQDGMLFLKKRKCVKVQQGSTQNKKD